jgi:VanZ family protein
MLRMVPMVITMGTIFFLSHQSGNQLSLPPIPGIDKLGHMVIYGILAGTTLFAFSETQKSTKPRSLMLFTVAFCVLYGMSDEFHQSFIPGRFVSIYDVFADGAGATVACALWSCLRKRGFFINLVGVFFAKWQS